MLTDKRSLLQKKGLLRDRIPKPLFKTEAIAPRDPKSFLERRISESQQEAIAQKASHIANPFLANPGIPWILSVTSCKGQKSFVSSHGARFASMN